MTPPAHAPDFLAASGWAGADILPLAGDASFRRYFRVVRGDESAVLMDAPPPHENPRNARRDPGNSLGLTPREVEVLALVSRGYTDREIAAVLVISVKTASVHVSHILHKLGAPNRLEAAAIAHRVAPEPVAQPEPEAWVPDQPTRRRP
jgi:DNA-binding CsgD family transcriptional regulator